MIQGTQITLLTVFKTAGNAETSNMETRVDQMTKQGGYNKYNNIQKIDMKIQSVPQKYNSINTYIIQALGLFTDIIFDMSL